MTETPFTGAGGERLMGAQVPLPRPWRGRTKLVKMLAASVTECVDEARSSVRKDFVMLLGLPERERVGRIEGIDDLLGDLEIETGFTFDRDQSLVFPHGRVSGLLALERARELVAESDGRPVLIAGVDSLLTGKSLGDLLDRERLLTPENSNGFIPGEAAACVLVERTQGPSPAITCVGTGAAEEDVTIDAEEPFRANGLTRAIAAALADARIDMADCAVRLTDLSGEHYYFRETALAVSRLLRREGASELWHPAECVGEVGAAIGPILLGYAAEAARKGFLPGPTVLVHTSADAGSRAAACLRVEA